MTTTDRSAAAAPAPVAFSRPRHLPDVGAVAVVHPKLPLATARALLDAGVARLGSAGDVEIWVRYPGR